MNVLKLLTMSIAVAGLILACNPAGDVKEKAKAPSYGKEQTEETAPAYGKEEVKEQAPSYGEAKAPSYGEAKAPSYGEVKAPSYGEANAPSYGMMVGDIEKGKALFNDTMFGNGTSGKSCNSCHLGGRGLEMAGEKKEFNIMGKRQNSLEEAVNFCIEMALKGTAIDPKGKNMTNIVAYIKSLKAE